LFYRQLGNYRQIIKTPKLEFCGLIKNANKIGPINQMMQVFLNGSKNSIHACPYKIGSFRMDNYTDQNSNLSFFPFPSGDYKTIFQLSAAADDNIIQIVLKSFVKTEFTGDF